jgi:predicted aminopeptidase
LSGTLRTVLIAAAAPLLASCQSWYVLSQGVGQLRLLSKQVRLDAPDLEKTATAEEIEMLRWVPEILELARAELALDPGDSYRTYLDTEDAPLSYAVTACHPLALLPYRWSFPFVGQVPYKGYFDEGDANAEADRLRARGLECSVLPVAAFSTLGWFKDPVTTPMLRGGIAELADTLIHETTHRTLYIKGSTSFNESLATHMGREGTIRFLAAHEELRHLLPAYLEARAAAMEREEILLRVRNDLDALYRSPVGDEAKLARKMEIFETASRAQALLRPGSAAIPASNSALLSFARYHEFEPLLRELQDVLGGEPAALVTHLGSLEDDGDPVRAIEETITASRQ